MSPRRSRGNIRAGTAKLTKAGDSRLMTTSGVASLARTSAPRCTSRAPVRPVTGAVMRVFCRWILAFSTAALPASIDASIAAADAAAES